MDSSKLQPDVPVDKDKPIEHSHSGSGSVSTLEDFGRSLAYSAVVSPICGVVQLGAMFFGKDIKPWTFLKPENQNGLAEQIGGALGFALDFWAINRLAGGCKVSALDQSAKLSGLSQAADRSAIMRVPSLIGSIKRAAVIGGLYEGIAQPVNSKGWNFAFDRLRNAAVGSATFATLEGASNLLPRLPGFSKLAQHNNFLTRSTFGALSGVPGGLASAEAQSLAYHARPTLDVGQSITKFAIIGGVLGALPRGAATRSAPKEIAGGDKTQPAQPDHEFEEDWLGSMPDPSVLPAHDSSAQESSMEATKPAVLPDRSREAILQGARDFTHELLDRYPQVNADGKLNYYLGGSLGTMLLMQAGEFEPIDTASLPRIAAEAPTRLPPETVAYLQHFIRPIGDLDYVKLEHYNHEAVRLRRGSGGPAYNELSASARELFRPDSAIKVTCDSLEGSGGHDVVRINLDGRDVYVGGPWSTYAYKLINIAERFSNFDSTAERMAHDFSQIHGAVKGLYQENTLVQATHDAIFAYVSGTQSASELYIHAYHPAFTDELRSSFDAIVAADPDAKYLDGLQYGKERSIGILKLLHRMPTVEAKQSVIDFINNHRESIDRWRFTGSEKNQTLVAQEILRSRPDILPRLRVTGEPTMESVIRGVYGNSWAIDEISKDLPYGTLDAEPTRSDTLDLLLAVDPGHASEELSQISELLTRYVDRRERQPTNRELGAISSDLQSILASQYASRAEERATIFSTLRSAADNLTADQFETFVLKYKEAVAETVSYARGKPTKIKEEDRPALIANVLKEFNLAG